MKERLHKYLARCGIASRREAEKMISHGRVQVNGKTVTTLGTTVDPHQDIVKVDGKTIKEPEKPVYIMLNKPKGYVTTASDDRGRPTVLDLVKNVPVRVFPVGRLDMDTEGLLLLTNDGDLAYQLTHPKFEVKKTYHALVKGRPSREALNKLRHGIMLDGKVTAPAKVRVINYHQSDTLLVITIHEGRNRQVRRMLDKIGHPVIHLKRVKFANLALGNLGLGKTRYLTKEEIQKLIQAVPISKA